jgi:hypothetical protein
MIRYYVLHKKSNTATQAKFSLGYGKDALCQRPVGTWAAHFRSGRTSVEDDERPGRPSSDSLSDIVSDYLNRNSQASRQEIAKDLFILMTIILRILDEIDMRFFIARWMPYKLSPELKANRIEICQEILEILEKPGSRQIIILLQGMNAGFIEIIIPADNRQQIVRPYLLEFGSQFH